MPEFRLRMWAEQVLFDCRDYVVEADTLEDAVELLESLKDKLDSGKGDVWGEVDHDNVEPGVRELDPEEIVDGNSGITLIDEDGNRVRDLEGVPTGCVQLGEPLE